MRSQFFYVNHDHAQNYEALRLYYSQADESPIIDGACYVLAIPEIFNVVNIFVPINVFPG